MQNNNCKTKNVNLPTNGRDSKIPTFHPIHTCIEQSPVCLIKDHQEPCTHKHCLMAYKKPQWMGLSKSELYNREEFLQFSVEISDDKRLKGYEHILPKNPNPGSQNGFESFRQSNNAVTLIAGAWPVGITVVDRKDVEIRWTEFTDDYPYTSLETLKTVWLQRSDVQEYAFYTGSFETKNSLTFDPMFKSPVAETIIVDLRIDKKGGHNE